MNAKTSAVTPAISLTYSHFKKKDRECFDCGSKWVAHEEKETDVAKAFECAYFAQALIQSV
jgi:hypothetical protein